MISQYEPESMCSNNNNNNTNNNIKRDKSKQTTTTILATNTSHPHLENNHRINSTYNIKKRTTMAGNSMILNYNRITKKM